MKSNNLPRFALAVFILACAGAERAPAAALPPPPHDEAALVELCGAFYRAFDTADADAFRGMLAPDFLRVGVARFYSGEMTVGGLRSRRERGYPKFSDRQLSLTRVRFSGDVALFSAMSSYRALRAEGVEPLTVESSEVLVWIHRDGAWRLINWQSEPSGPDTDRARWNLTYALSSNLNLKPNQLLIEAVHGKKPGRALDLGIGQGRNALFLASQGWQVTGVDVSDEGIRQAHEAAKVAGLTLTTEVADLDLWDWGENRWELIAFIYMGDKPDVARMRRALAPGGLVVIEFFMADATKGTGIGGFQKGALPALFADGFEVLRYDEVVDVADWGLQRVPLVRFVARKL